MTRGYHPFRASACSKGANLLSRMSLPVRSGARGSPSTPSTPGRVRTKLGSRTRPLRSLGWRLVHLRHLSVSVDPERGADAIVFVASSPDVASVSGDTSQSASGFRPLLRVATRRRLNDSGPCPSASSPPGPVKPAVDSLGQAKPAPGR